MSPPVWPADVLRPLSRAPHVSGVSLRGGRAFGLYQTESDLSGGGIWVDTLEGIPLHTNERRRVARAWAARLAVGRPVVMPFDRDPAHAGYMTEFADFQSADFPAGRFTAPTATGAASADAALRSKTLSVSITGAVLLGGERFSINHPGWGWRAYEIAYAKQTADGAYDLVIEPGLREAVPSGAAISFSDVRCLMKCADTAALKAALKVGLSSLITVSFIEYLGKP